MSLPRSALLAPNFEAWELGADRADIPFAAQSNLYKTAAWLQAARARFGGSAITVNTGLLKNRGWRPVDYAGDSDTSDHPEGLAADYEVRGVSQFRQYELMQAGGFPRWDQIIFYPLTGHTHVGLGSRMRGEFRIKLHEPGYPLLTPALVAKLRGAGPALLVLLAVALFAVALLRKGA